MSADTASGASLRRVRLDEPPVDQIHATLRRAILSLELAPGARVSEADIARAVGASRTPVRAALARLGEEGLIETRPSRGNYVTRFGAEAIRGAHFVRDALESTAVAHLAREGLDETMAARLKANLAAARKAVRQGDDSLFGELDDAFHHLLAEATGHERLVHVLVREKARLSRLRSPSPGQRNYQRRIVEEHAGIVEAILARDESAARARLSAHIGRLLTTLAELQRRHADFFEDEA